MRIYLSAPYSHKYQIQRFTDHLQKIGFYVTSTWPNEPHPPEVEMEDVPRKELEILALTDRQEMDIADTMIFFSTDQPFKRGGRHVEYGYMLAQKKRIVVIGPPENLFHHLPEIKHFTTWLDAVEYLISERDALHLVTTED